MYRIKRTKQGPPTVQVRDGKRVEIPGPVAVHYAAAVSHSGVIERWEGDPAKAVAITEGVARRVGEFYKDKPNVGDLKLEAVDASAASLAKAVAAEDAVGAAEFAKLQAECKRLVAENVALVKENEKARNELKAAQEALKRAELDKSDAMDSAEHKGDQIAKLTARVAELEADLNTATEPDESPKGGKKK